jgi:hypothetical protein
MTKKTRSAKSAVNKGSKWIASATAFMTIFSGVAPMAALANDGVSADHDIFISNPSTVSPTSNGNGTWDLDLEGVVGGKGESNDKFIRVTWGDSLQSESRLPAIYLKEIKNEQNQVIDVELSYDIIGNPDNVAVYLPPNGSRNYYGTRLVTPLYPEINGDWMARHTYAGDVNCVTAGSCTVVVEVRECANAPVAGFSFCSGESTFLDSHTINVAFPTTPPPPSDPTITFVKTWVGMEEGEEAPMFTLRFGGEVVATGTAYTRASGSYSISEDELEGFTSEVTCIRNGEATEPVTQGQISIAPGNSYVCTFTNTEDPEMGTLTLIKAWDFLGEEQTESTSTYPTFSISLDGTAVLPTEAEETPFSTTTEVLVGTHTITEASIEGFTSSISCNIWNGEGWNELAVNQGSFAVEEDDQIECTVTNTEVDGNTGGGEGSGTLIVKKQVTNNATGTYVAEDFLISVTRGEIVTTFRGNGEGVPFTIAAGTAYEVTESEFLATEIGEGGLGESDVAHGYSAYFGANCTGTIEAGETVECVIINDDPGAPDGDPGSNGGNGGSNGGGGGAGNLTANNAVGGSAPSSFVQPPGQVAGVQDTAETLLTCAEQYPDAALITGELEALLAAYGFTRDAGREQNLTSVVSKIVPASVVLTQQQIISNFVVYGIQALVHLGAGERAGIVASFNLLYGHMPQNECDWQNVIRIGQGVMPVVLSPERETTVLTAFEEIYNRPADRTVTQDNITVLIMSYGLRPDVRSLSAEIQANGMFRSVFGHFPQNTGEWDIMRGIAYGGITVPGFPAITR